MKKVLVDVDGLLKSFWVKDGAETIDGGIPDNIPDLNRLDWESIRTRLHNELTQENFTTWQDIQRRPDIFQGIILAVVRNDIINLYKVYDQEVKDGKHHSASKDGT